MTLYIILILHNEQLQVISNDDGSLWNGTSLKEAQKVGAENALCQAPGADWRIIAVDV